MYHARTASHEMRDLHDGPSHNGDSGDAESKRRQQRVAAARRKRDRALTKKGRGEFSRAARNLRALMARYSVTDRDIAAVLNMPDVGFVEKMFESLDKQRSYALSRERTARLATLFAEHGADKEEVFRQLMSGNAAGSLAWLLHSEAGLAVKADEEIVDELRSEGAEINNGPVNIDKLRRLYNEFKESTMYKHKPFVDALEKVLARRGIPSEQTRKSLLGMGAEAAIVAFPAALRVPILDTSALLRVDWGITEGQELVGEDADNLMDAIRSLPGLRWDETPPIHANAWTIEIRIEDDRNAPFLRLGALVQVDVRKKSFVPGCQYAVLIGTGARRRPVLGRYTDSEGGLLMADNYLKPPVGIYAPVVVSEGVTVVGRVIGHTEPPVD